ncbi:MAG: hypothetical protein QXU52_02345 [Fervidicoccaceae archaeon]
MRSSPRGDGKPTILFADYYLPRDQGLETGYVYVEGGVIAELGYGETPDDLRSAALIYEGWGRRLLLPGLSSPVIHLGLYPLRTELGFTLSFDAAWRSVAELSRREYSLLMLLGLRELIEKGYTSFGLFEPKPSAAAEVVAEYDLDALIIAPSDVSPMEAEREALSGLEASEIWIDRAERLEGPRGITLGLSLGSATALAWPSAEMCDKVDYYAVGHNASFSGRLPILLCDEPVRARERPPRTLKRLTRTEWKRGEKPKLDGSWLERGGPADLISVKLDEPPLAGLRWDDIAWVLSRLDVWPPALETVVIKGEVVVDGGQQLLLEEPLLSLAEKVVEKVRVLAMRRGP